jgi:hypothetical protein
MPTDQFARIAAVLPVNPAIATVLPPVVKPVAPEVFVPRPGRAPDDPRSVFDPPRLSDSTFDAEPESHVYVWPGAVGFADPYANAALTEGRVGPVTERLIAAPDVELSVSTAVGVAVVNPST